MNDTQEFLLSLNSRQSLQSTNTKLTYSFKDITTHKPRYVQHRSCQPPSMCSVAPQFVRESQLQNKHWPVKQAFRILPYWTERDDEFPSWQSYHLIRYSFCRFRTNRPVQLVPPHNQYTAAIRPPAGEYKDSRIISLSLGLLSDN